MSIDQILRKILSNKDFQNYWPEIINVEAENLNTIKMKMDNNIYLKYLHTVLSNDNTNNNVRKNIVSKLISN